MKNLLLALFVLIACQVADIAEPDQVDAFVIEYNKDGTVTVTKTCEGFGWLIFRASIMHNDKLLTPFCATRDNSMYRHTITNWNPGDRIWADVWPMNGKPDQTVILK